MFNLNFVFYFFLIFFKIVFSNEKLDNFSENISNPIKSISNIDINGLINDYDQFKNKNKLSLLDQIKDIDGYEDFLISTCIRNIFLPGIYNFNYLDEKEENKNILKKIISDENYDLRKNGIKNIKNFLNYCIEIQENKIGKIKDDEFIVNLSSISNEQKVIYCYIL